jgi:hypothetical protein
VIADWMRSFRRARIAVSSEGVTGRMIVRLFGELEADYLNLGTDYRRSSIVQAIPAHNHPYTGWRVTKGTVDVRQISAGGRRAAGASAARR